MLLLDEAVLQLLLLHLLRAWVRLAAAAAQARQGLLPLGQATLLPLLLLQI